VGTSDIIITSATITRTVKGNAFSFIVSDPWAISGLERYKLKTVEVWAATTNDRTLATKVVEGLSDVIHSGVPEEETRYYWFRARNNLDSPGPYYPVSSTGGLPSTSLGQAGGNFTLQNGQLVPSAAGGALTIRIKTALGNDPSESDPVFISFPNGNGTYSIKAIIAPISLIIVSGATFGAVNNIAFRVWVLLFNDNGTLRMAAANCAGELLLDESAATSATTLNVNSDNALTIYSGASFTGAYYRTLGYLTWEDGLVTVGTWVAPSSNTLFADGMKKPGEIIHKVTTTSTASVTGTTIIPADNTVPLTTEGIQLMLRNVGTISKANYLEHDAQINCSWGNSATFSRCALYVLEESNSGATVVRGVAWGYLNDQPGEMRLSFRQAVPEINILPYFIFGGAADAGTFRMNSLSTGQLYGGSLISSYSVAEIMG
jgi:hypothetical protein